MGELTAGQLQSLIFHKQTPRWRFDGRTGAGKVQRQLIDAALLGMNLTTGQYRPTAAGDAAIASAGEKADG